MSTGTYIAASPLDAPSHGAHSVTATRPVFLLLIGLVALGSLAALWFSDVQYTSRTSLLVEQIDGSVGGEGAKTLVPLDDDGVAAQIQTIRAEPLLRRVFLSSGFEDHALVEQAKAAKSNNVITSLLFGFDPIDVKSEQERLMGWIQSRLRVFKDAGSGLIMVEFSTNDPSLASNISNAIADAYAGQQAESSNGVDSDKLNELEAALAVQRDRSENAQRLIAQAKVSRLDDALGDEASAKLAKLRREAAVQSVLLNAAMEKFQRAKAVRDGSVALVEAKIVSFSRTPVATVYPLLSKLAALCLILSVLAGAWMLLRQRSKNNEMGSSIGAETKQTEMQNSAPEMNHPSPVAPENSNVETVGSDQPFMPNNEDDRRLQVGVAPSIESEIGLGEGEMNRGGMMLQTNGVSDQWASSDQHRHELASLKVPMPAHAQPTEQDVEQGKVKVAKAQPKTVRPVSKPSIKPVMKTNETKPLAVTSKSYVPTQVDLMVIAKSLTVLNTARVVVLTCGDETVGGGAVALARLMSSVGSTVILDMAGDAFATKTMLHQPEVPGMKDLLSRSVSFGEAIHHDIISNAHIVPFGTSNAQLTASSIKLVRGIIDKLQENYQYVVIDAGHANLKALARMANKKSGIVVNQPTSDSPGELSNLTQMISKSGFSEPVVMTITASDANAVGIAV